MVRMGILVLALGTAILAGANAADGRSPRKPPRAVRAASASKASTAPPAAPAFVLPPPAPAPAQVPSRFGLIGQKYAGPQTGMSQAGVVWSLGDHLSVHLSYERTAYAPLMPRDHDNGVLTGLRLAF